MAGTSNDGVVIHVRDKKTFLEFWVLAGFITTVKLLFLETYHSTDFDVHRNWLAITHSLPVRKWYFEATSQWTLDYPPLFAWFEYLLSLVAQYFDPKMLNVKNVTYASRQTIVFQKLSVIVTDFVFICAVKELYTKCLVSRKLLKNSMFSADVVQAVLLVSNMGLLLVDHIHFQYNGFLFGVLFLSIVRIYEGRHLSAGFWFAILLNLKHIFLYIAPVYFIYLLRHYVLQGETAGRLRWLFNCLVRLVGLGLVVLLVFMFSFGPFIILGQVPQVLSRLFPFKRGLCHAYWAPNFWALYNVADKGAQLAGSRLGVLSVNQSASMTGGLVQQFNHTVLPSISPLVTLVLSAASMLPGLAVLWTRPGRPQNFVRALVVCAFGSFMFGWHVHEKAVLLIIIPFSLLVVESKTEAKIFLILSTVGHYSLFPLFFTRAETLIKVSLLAISTLYAFLAVSNVYNIGYRRFPLPLLSWLESLYLVALVPLELYNSLIHPWLGLGASLPFLPLLLTSFYCALGLVYCWIYFYWTFLSTSQSHRDNYTAVKSKTE